jgi:hypothetical protein
MPKNCYWRQKESRKDAYRDGPKVLSFPLKLIKNPTDFHPHPVAGKVFSQLIWFGWNLLEVASRDAMLLVGTE